MEKKRKVFLIGIGTGARGTMTFSAEECISQCDCLIGAGRMIDSVLAACPEAGTKKGDSSGADGNGDNRSGVEKERLPVLREYDSDRICEYISAHPEYERVGILLSGDTGFYSGAKKLAEKLTKPTSGETAGVSARAAEERYEVTMLPGISSIVYLAAKIKTSWEDAGLLSLHGREENFIQTVNRNEKTFLLLGGKGTGKAVREKLIEYGLEDVTVHIGTNLSYPEERIVTGRPAELDDEDFEGLCAALVVNPAPDKSVCPHIADSEFIRGRVPMTKEEVRSVSLAKLRLAEHSVVYDIGAGTGSVSVEAALSGEGIRVYAIEKNEEAAGLIRQNRKKFKADGIRITQGTAPGILKDLEPPTHVFIGGSSGSLKEILKTVYEKNRKVRIVINAISLETVSEVMSAIEEGLITKPDIVQLSAARSRELGRYHMMTGQNPVYIISAGGEAQ